MRRRCQAVVGQLGGLANEEDVVRLHVAVLEADPSAFARVLAGVQKVECLRDLPHVAAQLRRVDMLCEIVVIEQHQVEQRRIGQLHVDDDVSRDRPDLVRLDQVRVIERQE